MSSRFTTGSFAYDAARPGLTGAAGIGAGVALWAAVFLCPMAVLCVGAARGSSAAGEQAAGAGAGAAMLAAAGRSAGIAAAVAAAAVVLGYVPAALLAAAGGGGAGPRRDRRAMLLLLALLAPLLLPNYVLYYAWAIFLSPTAALGRYLSMHPEAARAAGTAASAMVLMLWHWPLAALVMAQGRREIPGSVFRTARLDAPPWRRFCSVTLPLLARPVAMAFAVCFVLALSETTTFHLAGIGTLGTELAALYERTGDEALVARWAWPMAIPAVAVACLLWRSLCRPRPATMAADGGESAGGRTWQWVFVVALAAVSCAAPVGLFAVYLTDASPFQRILAVQGDALGWSALAAIVGAAAALGVSAAAVAMSRAMAPDSAAAANSGRAWPAIIAPVSAFMHVTILLAMLLPPALIAAAILRAMSWLNVPAAFSQSWLAVSTGLTVRLAGMSLVLLHQARASQDRRLSAMAAVDGATRMQAFLHVHLPRLWPLVAGAAMLTAMMGLTEAQATMILLPPGLPNFAQGLVNQMHYLRDQQVIASCLTLVGVYMLLVAAAAGLLRLFARRGLGAAAMAVACVGACVLACGCGAKGADSAPPKVVGSFGQTGAGAGEFLYPRAIDRAADGTLWVIDKTGRVQHFSPQGTWLGGFAMPAIDTGKPTGLTVAPDGRLYVADTHYHRIAIFTPDGNAAGQFGKYGTGDGCFIYPTDVAFAPDGRVFVSEYGGNDRVSVYTPRGEFAGSFGRSGSGDGEFSRPAALAVDAKRGRLYVADACNHRIAVYDIANGRDAAHSSRNADAATQAAGMPVLFGYFGGPGTAAGQLRYPYGLAMTAEGMVAVCEFGNNRIQVFTPDGRSVRVCGGAGRELGQLAYPWSLAVGGDGAVFVVDAGNNRIQVWQL